MIGEYGKMAKATFPPPRRAMDSDDERWWAGTPTGARATLPHRQWPLAWGWAVGQHRAETCHRLSSEPGQAEAGFLLLGPRWAYFERTSWASLSNSRRGRNDRVVTGVTPGQLSEHSSSTWGTSDHLRSEQLNNSGFKFCFSQFSASMQSLILGFWVHEIRATFLIASALMVIRPEC